jgi:putative ABC transport system permease protein
MGVAIGILFSLIVARVMQGMLYSIRHTDPLTYALVAVLMMAVTLFAAALAARRAGKVDPITALRSE